MRDLEISDDHSILRIDGLRSHSHKRVNIAVFEGKDLANVWITDKDAEDIISHLKNVFNLEE